MECRICANGESNQFISAQEKMFGSQESFEYLKCSVCGCLQIVSYPQDLGRHYPEDYYSFSEHESAGLKGSVKAWIRKKRNQYAVSHKGTLGKMLYQKFPNESLFSIGFMKPNIDSKILDVGCGSGSHLRDLSDLGFRNVLGVDPYIQNDVTYKGKKLVVRSSLEDLQGSFDIVMLHHSFEHMQNQLETLQNLRRLVSESGTLLLRVPLCSSEAFETYGVNWVQLDAPRHLYLHTARSIETLAKQAQLEVSKVVYDSAAFQFWGSELYQNGHSLYSEESFLKNPSKVNSEKMQAFVSKAKELNSKARGDQACFYLKWKAQV